MHDLSYDTAKIDYQELLRVVRSAVRSLGNDVYSNYREVMNHLERKEFISAGVSARFLKEKMESFCEAVRTLEVLEEGLRRKNKILVNLGGEEK
ncbi:hypothetical protein DRN73_05295 [Candidatus Pacearchaeota archaeon]|nr:MAG: hypothetical protein DRN73_05295 [Candidatus Pacearchaeota archaeon]